MMKGNFLLFVCLIAVAAGIVSGQPANGKGGQKKGGGQGTGGPVNTDSYGSGVLSPVCTSGKLQANPLTSGNQTLRVASSSKDQGTTYPLMECFSYLRSATFKKDILMTDDEKATCETAAELTAIDMVMYNAENDEVMGTSPLDWIFGNAIHGTAYPMTAAVYINIFITAPNIVFPRGCEVSVLYSHPTSVYKTAKAFVTEPAPRIHNLNPAVAVKGETQTFSFVRPRNSDLVSGQTGDQFYIASREGCLGGPSYTLDDTAYPTYDDVDTVNASSLVERHAVRGVNGSDEVFAHWDYKFNSHGLFFLCVKPYQWQPFTIGNQNVGGLELALITVHGGNPAFFTVYGKTPTQKLRLERKIEYTFVLEGVALDLRPGKDQAKLIDPNYGNCTTATGERTAVTDDLGASDEYGQDVSIARWTVVFRRGGPIWVCYKRFGAPWGRVFPLRALSSGAQELAMNLSHLENFHQDDTFAPQVPTPTGGGTNGPSITTTDLPMVTFTPVPGTSGGISGCVTQVKGFVYAPDSAPGSWVALQVTDPDFDGQSLAQAIANVLCLELPLVYLSKAYQQWTYNSEGDASSYKWEVRVELACVKECSNDEKLAYLAWLFGTEGANSAEAQSAISGLTNAGVQAATPDTDRNGAVVVASGPADDDDSNFLILVIVVVLCLILIALIAGVVVFLILRRSKQKERRQRAFQQGQFEQGQSAAMGNRQTNQRDSDGVDIEVETRQESGPPGAAWDIDPAQKGTQQPPAF